MQSVVAVEYKSDYKLIITFENKNVKLVDLESYLSGPIFQPLKNIEYFKKVKLNPDIDTIVWDNEADFSPDFLYEIGKTMPEMDVVNESYPEEEKQNKTNPKPKKKGKDGKNSNLPQSITNPIKPKIKNSQ